MIDPRDLRGISSLVARAGGAAEASRLNAIAARIVRMNVAVLRQKLAVEDALWAARDHAVRAAQARAAQRRMIYALCGLPTPTSDAASQ